jgi:hypothetical protein
MAAPQIQITRFAQGWESSRQAFEIIEQVIQSPTTTSPETAAREVNKLYISYTTVGENQEDKSNFQFISLRAVESHLQHLVTAATR